LIIALNAREFGLTGARSTRFSVVDGAGGKELWFNGGANDEAKASYAVTVAVDDGGVGGTPDASTDSLLPSATLMSAPADVDATGDAVNENAAGRATTLSLRAGPTLKRCLFW
jgi:hypothetical protein